jgi:hypothetical protein
MASVKEFQVTFDCAEPERVARFGARCWVTSYRRHRKGSPIGTISTARCRLRIGVHGSHALIPRVWARDCSSSAFPIAHQRVSRTRRTPHVDDQAVRARPADRIPQRPAGGERRCEGARPGAVKLTCNPGRPPGALLRR